MKKQATPGSRYQVQCPACGFFVPVVLFQASCHDFDSYVGTATGTLYRLDRTLIVYGRLAEEDALAPARMREREAGGDLVRVRDNVRCQHCPTVFAFDDTCPAPEEPVEVSAICLPVE
jgi:hypothetical protein